MQRDINKILLAIILVCWMGLASEAADRAKAPSKTKGFIKVSADGKGFIFETSRTPFVPWGFNYDRDASHRLLESYWKNDWKTVEEDFREMKSLGATTVRIHLQFSQFMKSPHEPNKEQLRMLSRLLSLAERSGLYLDITGLGCYDREDVPKWYDALAEQERWAAQARFWEFIADTCKSSSAVFCYDLMNEPVVTAGSEQKEWLTGQLGGFYYVQRINLTASGRSQKEIAKAWVNKLVEAIRAKDKKHLITVGAIPWELTFPNATPLFYSREVSERLDFVSVHFYPKRGEIEKAVKALGVYDIGKPIVVEEIFPLSCSLGELDQFLLQSRPILAGVIGFYWGQTIQDYEQKKRTIGEEITLGWLRYFAKKSAATPKSGEKPWK